MSIESNKETANNLALELIGDQWFIVKHEPPIGPYDTKAEAQEALTRTAWFYRHYCISDSVYKETIDLEELLS